MKFDLDRCLLQVRLAPHLSEETLSTTTRAPRDLPEELGEAPGGQARGRQSLEEIVKTASGGIFNNAAQVWNHVFHWRSMEPGGGGEPSGAFADAIKRDFGNYSGFTTQFQTAGNN